MKYYDLHVEADDKEAVEMAKQLGFSAIGVTNPELRNNEIEIISCVMIKPKNKEELNNKIDKYREKVEVILVYGGDYEINRAACEDSRVDILCHPEMGRNDSGLDHICVKAAAENDVCIEINFNSVLNSKNRPKILSYLQHNIYLCKKYNAKIITTSGAKSKWELRAPRELASLTHLLGLDIKSAIDSLSVVPESIININREKLSGKRIGDVKIVE